MTRRPSLRSCRSVIKPNALFVLRGLIHHDAVADAESDRAVRSVELHLFPRLSGLEVRGFVNDIGADRFPTDPNHPFYAGGK
jgi:hypothetical protein